LLAGSRTPVRVADKRLALHPARYGNRPADQFAV